VPEGTHMKELQYSSDHGPSHFTSIATRGVQGDPLFQLLSGGTISPFHRERMDKTLL
jgi:hypothetical protein